MTLAVDGGVKAGDGPAVAAESPSISNPQHRKDSTTGSVSTSPSSMRDFIKQKFKRVSSTTRKSASSNGSTKVATNPFSPQPLDGSERALSSEDLTKLPSQRALQKNSNDIGAVSLHTGLTDRFGHYKTTIDNEHSPHTFGRDARSMSLNHVSKLPPVSPLSNFNSSSPRRIKSVGSPAGVVGGGHTLRDALPKRRQNFAALDFSERSEDFDDILACVPDASPTPDILGDSRSDLLTIVDDDILPVDSSFVQFHITDQSEAVVLSPRNLLPEYIKKKKDQSRQSQQLHGGEVKSNGDDIGVDADADTDAQRNLKPPRSPRRSASASKALSPPGRPKYLPHQQSPPSPPASESPIKTATKGKKSPRTPTSKSSSKKKGSGGNKHHRSTVPGLSPLGTPSSSKGGKKQSVDANIAELVMLISPESAQKRSTYLQQFHAGDLLEEESTENHESSEVLELEPLPQLQESELIEPVVQ